MATWKECQCRHGLIALLSFIYLCSRAMSAAMIWMETRRYKKGHLPTLAHHLLTGMVLKYVSMTQERAQATLYKHLFPLVSRCFLFQLMSFIYIVGIRRSSIQDIPLVLLLSSSSKLPANLSIFPSVVVIGLCHSLQYPCSTCSYAAIDEICIWTREKLTVVCIAR